MEQIQKIRNERKKGGTTRINEGKEKGNNRTVTTPRPRVQPAPQKTEKGDKK